MKTEVFTIDLGMFTDEDKEKLENDINIKKSISRIVKKSRNMAKKPRCYYCGEPIDGFCNSHSIPLFCLKNIALNGEVKTLNSLINNPILESEVGVKKAGTFQMICRTCDNKIFSDYETPENYNVKPTQRMITQIALKNYLKAIYKREVELNLAEATWDVIGQSNVFMEIKEGVNELDLKEYKSGFDKAKNALTKNRIDTYYLCYYKKLDYTVPIAFQSSVALVFDLEGNLINDIYCPKRDYEIKNIHICIFPLEDSSCIMMFTEGGDKRYRKFYKQFNRLSLDDQLATLTFIMFAYSEEIYYSPTIQTLLTEENGLFDIARTTSDILATTLDFNALEVLKDKINLDKRCAIPNLLSEAYKLR